MDLQLRQNNINRYGFPSIEAIEGKLALVEKQLAAADAESDEAWFEYNRKVGARLDATIAAEKIEASAVKIDELNDERDRLEALHEEWSRDDAAKEHRELERYLRR